MYAHTPKWDAKRRIALYRHINRRFNSRDEYRAEIEKASIIIKGTESMEVRAKWWKYRMRLEKELFSLMEVENDEQRTKEI